MDSSRWMVQEGSTSDQLQTKTQEETDNHRNTHKSERNKHYDPDSDDATSRKRLCLFVKEMLMKDMCSYLDCFLWGINQI